MPTYDYVCGECGYKFEKFQSIKEEPIHKCPVCGKESAKRLISSGNGFIFKGSGFYATDYRSANYKRDKEKAEKKSDSSADSTTSKPKEKEKAETNSG
ncbi:zinc ribbon domain-containing protein [candidate division KSB1 bacterium]|nr:zinc ribbon domain-containing protein [candidate division KSB1 bacterium]